MAKDVLITPASGIIEFKDTTGVVDGVVQLDDSGNLNITHPGGNLNLGNPGTPVYIGDGVNSVDIIFEQNGAVRALTGKTLTLGQADSFVTSDALTTITSLRSFSNTNDPAAATTMFGRDSSQSIRLHGGSAANYVSSLSTDTNPKNFVIRANRGTTNRDFLFASDTGTLTAAGFIGPLTGNADTATALQTARTIGGVSFNGTANINLPGVNTAGNQNTSGNAATATNVAYSGLTGTVPTWNQNTTGNAATATNVAYSGLTGTVPTWNQNTTGSAATLTTGRTIALTGDVSYTSGSFNGSANVTGTATLASVGTSGTYTKVTTDAKGRVTSGTTLAAADIPTLNQNTTGSAATLTTGRTINGVSFNGSANITITAANPSALTIGTGLSGTSYTGSSAVTIAIDSTVATLTGTQTLTNKTLTSPQLTTAPYVNGSYRSNIVAVAALDINCSLGNYFTKTISGNSTFTFSSVPASVAYSFTLELTHTSGSVTWPAAVQWPGATAPSLTTAKTHLFMFVTDDGGTRWRGAALVDYTT